MKMKGNVKRILALVLSLALLCTGQPITSRGSGEESDQTFESFDSWTFLGAGNDSLSVTEGLSGNGALVTKAGAGSSQLLSGLISVKAESRYRAGVSLRFERGTASLAVQAYSDEEGQSPLGEETLIGTLEEAAEFTELAGDYMVPEGAGFVRLVVSLGDDNSKAGESYTVDHAVLNAYSSASALLDGWQGDDIWYRNGWTNTVTHYAQMAEEGYAEAGALYFHNTMPEADMPVAIEVGGVAPGEYTLTAWVKGTTTYDKMFHFLEFGHDADMVTLLDGISYPEWTKVEKTITVHADNELGLAIFVLYFGCYNWAADIYIDDVTLVNNETGVDALKGAGRFYNEGGYSLTSENLVENGDYEEVVYRYLPLEELNGTFEGAALEQVNFNWVLNDNDTGDTLALTDDVVKGKTATVTKGADAAAGEGWVTLSSPLLSVQSGMTYQVSFDARGEGTKPYFITTAYFFQNQTPVSSFNAQSEGLLNGDWSRKTAVVTVPDGADSMQLRIVCQGAAGDRLTYDNFAVNPMKTEPSLGDEWKYNGFYGNPDEAGVCQITLEEQGYQDSGSLHFYQDYVQCAGTGKYVHIGQLITNWEAKTYLFSAWIKGNTQTAGDPSYLELPWGLGVWKDTGSGTLPLQINAADWTYVEYEFTVTNAMWAPIHILCGGYSGADFYLDDIKICARDDSGKTNLLQNGSFCQSSGEADTTVNLVSNGGFEGMVVFTVPGWSAQGNIGYEKESGIVSLSPGASLTSLRYDVTGGTIYKYRFQGEGGSMTFTFDQGTPLTVTEQEGYVIIPEKASCLRIGYGAEEQQATISSVVLEEQEATMNLDFEVPANGSAAPYHWLGYPGEGAAADDYVMSWSADGGVDGSAAMKITAQKDNNGSYVVYSGRIPVEASAMYVMSFAGSYQGQNLTSAPLIRMYQANGAETVEGSSYNWLDGIRFNDMGYGDWNTYRSNFTTSGDTAYIEVRFEVIGHAAGSEFLFDNIELTKLENSDDPNLDFDTAWEGVGVLNWNGYDTAAYGDYSLSLAEGMGTNGSNALKVTSTRENTGSYVIYSVRIPAEPSMVYNMSFEGKYKGNDILAVPLIRMYRADGSETAAESSYNWLYEAAFQGNGTNVWNTYTSNYSTSADTAWIEVRFEVRGANAGAEFLFDDIRVKKQGAAGSPNLDFDFTSEGTGVYNWLGYNTDPNFSVDYEMSLGKGEGIDGTNALKVTSVKDNQASFVVYSSRIPVDASTVYSMEFWGNYSGTDLIARPLIRLYRADGSETTEASSYYWLNNLASKDNSSTWKYYTANFATSADTAYIEVRFEVAAPKAGVVFLFDSIQVERIGSAANANLDFETGENGKPVFNWNYYEYREVPGNPGNFETGSFGGYETYKADHAGWDGSAAAVVKKLNGEDIQFYLQSTVLAVAPGTYYSLEFDVMAENAKKNQIMLYVRQYRDAVGNSVANEAEAHLWLTDAYAYGAFDWKRTGASFRTAADAKYISVFLVVLGKEPSTTCFDNVSLTKADEIADPNLDFEYTSAGKPVNWSVTTSSGICEVASDSSVYYRGSRSMRVEKKYSEINYTLLSMSKTIPVKSEDSIEFMLHLRSRDAVNGTFGAVVVGLDDAGNQIEINNGHVYPLNSSDTLSEWVTYRINQRVSKNVTRVMLLLRIGCNEGITYIDSVEYYNYTQNENTVYAEEFAGPSDSGMFGGWEKETVSGSPAFGTGGEAEISGKEGDNGSIYTDVSVLGTDYTYAISADCRAEGSAEGKFVIEAIDWRGKVTDTVVNQEIHGNSGTGSIESSFIAPSATKFRVRFEKTGGSGSIFLDNVIIRQTAEPVRSMGWEGSWLVHPEDYNTILGNEHNEQYYDFRQEFFLEDEVRLGQIQISADDKFKLYINGREVYEETASGDTWSMPSCLDITEYLQKGKNVVAVRMYNNIYAYGLVYDGIVKMENDSSLRFVSDESVLVAKETSAWTAQDAEHYMDVDYTASASSGWVKATELCPVGQGSWGAIAFDNTEYSEYKIESNEFVFPKEENNAGEKISVSATLKLENALPDTSEFEIYFWKKNTTQKICSGTMTLAGGKTTDEWPVGEEFTAEFELKIPEFLATGEYTVQFDDLVSVVSDYYIGNKVGNVKVTQPDRPVTTTSEVKMINGKPTYFVNGIATSPLWHGRPEGDTLYDADRVAKYGEAGIETVIGYICLSGTYGEVWLEDGTIDSAPIDQMILGTLGGNPEAYLQVAIDTTAPQWWLEANPEECVKLNNGTLSKQTFSSMKWREECADIILQVLDYIMAQPYANRIAGIKLTGGATYEWQWWGMQSTNTEIGDFSSAGLEQFRSWLRERYKTEEALQKAWKDSRVTFDTAEVPSISARSNKQYETILSAQDNRAAVDYQLFMGDMQTDTILYFADLVKEKLDNRLTVGTYAGYLLNCTTYNFSTATGHTGYDRLLRSDSIDWIQSPWSYGGERTLGYMTYFMGAMASTTAHGKLVVVEADDRLNLNYMSLAQDSRAGVGWTRTNEESVSVMKRNFAYVLSNGQSMDFYDLYGNFYDDDQFYGLMSQMSQESTLSLGLERESVADVAVFMDMDMEHYLTFSGGDTTDELLYKSLLSEQFKQLNNIGAPYDVYLLDDLVDGLVPEHKVNIMLAATQITAEEREAIEKQLKKDQNVILWIFASGITDGVTTDVSLISEVTGIHVEQISVSTANNERKFMGTCQVTSDSHWLTEGLGDFTYGAIEYRTLAPVIAVKDSGAATIGIHEKTGLDGDYTALAVKDIMNADGSKWTSIYSAVPNFPTALLRNIMEHCGCHIYDENSSDLIFADNNYVAVHSLYAGERTIKLPGTFAVYDVFNRELVDTSTDTITFSLDAMDTRLFRLSEPKTVQSYITHTVGGSTSMEGLVTLTPGENLSFDFEADQGYQLDYLLVDGEKISAEEGSYTFSDVKESHTVIAKYVMTYDTEKAPVTIIEEWNWPVIIALIAGAAALIAAATVVIIILVKKKKKKASEEAGERKEQ